MAKRRAPANSPGRPPLPRLPRDGEIGHRRLRRFIVALSLFIVLMIAALAVMVVVAFGTIALPPDVPLERTTTVTDVKGNVLATYGQNRQVVELGAVSPVLIQAVVDTEDHNFYEHHGVDPRGTTRALYHDLRGNGGLQGGSTLTQQYVKQTYVGTDRTAWRKFKEAILAVKLEQRLSKDQILERYLNTIYWGRGAYGVQAASKANFDKDADQLNLEEASYLAGLIRGPELADVAKHPQAAADRRAQTLDSMVRYGHVTPDEAARVKAIPLTDYVTKGATAGNAKTTTTKAGAGSEYFTQYVRNILVQRYGAQTVDGGGLAVTTTLDPDLQNKAYQSVYGFLKPNEPSGALVSIDNDGYIQAMVGGRDFSKSEVNLATGLGGSGRQAGSTFKAFELAAATNAGVCYKEQFRGPAKMTIPGWNSDEGVVTNFDNESFGNIDLIKATEESVNTVYAQLVMQQGVTSLIRTAQDAGITTQLDPNPSLVLGSAEVTPLDMADAYLTFSQAGMHVTPNAIKEVKNADGDTLEKARPQRERVMSENTANVVNKALQEVVAGGTGRSAAIGKPVAGKTGTTEDNGDAWFVGYTPNLATAVWMGYPEGRSRTMNNVRGIAVTGGTFPAQIFSNYMRYATRDDDASGFDGPKDCRPSNYVAPTAPPSTSASTTTERSTTSTTTSLRTITVPSVPRRLTTTSTSEPDRTSESRPGRGNGRNPTTSTTGRPAITPIVPPPTD